VFLAQGTDARAMCFAARCVVDVAKKKDMVQRSPQLGYPLAQAMMCAFSLGAERLAWMKKTAAQEEPLGIALLGQCLRNGYGCDRDVERALHLYRKAAEMELGWVQFLFGRDGFSEQNPNGYVWWGKAAAQGETNACRELVQAAKHHVTLFNDRIVFEIGSACKTQLDVWRSESELKENLHFVVRAVEFTTNVVQTIFF
jgi:hypothetical protein